MKNLYIIILILSMAIIACKDKNNNDENLDNIMVQSSNPTDVLIKKKFRNKNTYLIICKGFPKQGLTGVAKIASAQDAAQINAVLIAKDVFKKAIDPSRDGNIEKMIDKGDHVVIYYVIEKNGLKRYLKKS